jgi:hypothetical protein
MFMKYPDGADTVNGFYVGASVGTRLADALAPADIDGLDYKRSIEHVGTVTGDARNTVTVSYDLNGASADAPDNDIVIFGASVKIASAPVISGGTFVEWNTLGDGTGVTHAPGETIFPTTGMTLYAIWEEINTEGD